MYISQQKNGVLIGTEKLFQSQLCMVSSLKLANMNNRKKTEFFNNSGALNCILKINLIMVRPFHL